MSNAEKKLQAALTLIDSDSVRAWAKSAHNYPIFLDLAKRWKGDKYTLSTYILSLAMGL